jgi:hypothetical protein
MLVVGGYSVPMERIRPWLNTILPEPLKPEEDSICSILINDWLDGLGEDVAPSYVEAIPVSRYPKGYPVLYMFLPLCQAEDPLAPTILDPFEYKDCPCTKDIEAFFEKHGLLISATDFETLFDPEASAYEVEYKMARNVALRARNPPPVASDLDEECAGVVC